MPPGSGLSLASSLQFATNPQINRPGNTTGAYGGFILPKTSHLGSAADDSNDSAPLVSMGLLSLGGRLNEKTMAPLLQWLIDHDRPQLALEIARIFLNWYNVQGVYAAFAESQSSH